MKIEQVKHALEIYRAGSINKAAQNLFIGQSSLSMSMRALETELGQEIFFRTQNGIMPTGFGLTFFEEATKMLAHYETILDCAAKTTASVKKAKFSVSVYYLLFASHAFTDLYKKHSQQYIDFSYHENSRKEVIQHVVHHISEIALITMPSIRKEQWLQYLSAYGLEYFLLSKEPPCILVGQPCGLYHKGTDSVEIADLKEYTMIAIEEQEPLFQGIDNEIFSFFRPRSFLRISDRGSLMGMLHQTDGYYVATTNQNAYRKMHFYDGIKSLPVTDASHHYEIAYIKRQKEPLSPFAQEYLEDIRKLLNNEESNEL